MMPKSKPLAMSIASGRIVGGTLDSGLRVPNGPAFAPDGQWAYLADSPLGIVYRYRLEPGGAIIGREDFLQFEPSDGFPDGMTTDANGCLWIAFWDGWCIRCFNPDGAQLRRIDLPVARPTSCAFGGSDLDQLFITSARTGLSGDDLADQPMAGGCLGSCLASMAGRCRSMRDDGIFLTDAPCPSP